jgi:DNA polymerase I
MDHEALLTGAEPTERVVAAEQAGSEVLLYVRHPDGVKMDRRPFRPWLYARDPYPFAAAKWERAEPALGDTWLGSIAWFPDWHSFVEARRELREAGAEHLAPGSPQRQFLTESGVTLFKGMSFQDLHRLQFDLETATLRERHADARILLIAVSDSHGFEEVLTGPEEQIIERLVALVRDRDPDVIEGHNVVDFDLPYLEARAHHVGVPLALGRDGSSLSRGVRRRLGGAGWGKEIASYYIHGRHIVDSMHAVQRFDVGRGVLEGFGLKYVAARLGVAEPERIILDRSKMADLVEKDPERVGRYAMQDVREVRAVAALVCPTDFYQAQMVPEGYQQVSAMGMGDKINALMQRAYLAARHPIPLPKPSEAVPGGYTEVRRTGVLKPVVKADAQSLYPSIMDRFEIAPESDRLGVFLPMLRELTRRRIEAKERMKKTKGTEQMYWDGLQGSFKVLINSFYGYLGTQLHFNDPKAAAEVTTRGQEIVKTASDEIESLGGQVIEVDTDGIYFVPPPDVRGEAAEAAFVVRVGAALPEGINLIHDGSYPAMLSLMVKNYVLQRPDGHLVFRGASMRSRADEPFGREFIETAVGLLLENRLDELTELYVAIARDIHDGNIPVEKLCRRERITQKTFESSLKKRSKAAAQELGAKVGDYVRVYETKSGDLKPVRSYDKDEDRDHYVDKLYRFAGRLRPALGDAFDAVFPKPGSPRLGLSSQPSLFE